MKEKIKFPKLSNKVLKQILTPPATGKKPLQVVLDTDFDNEVDDYFALAWLILQHKYPSENLNRINLKALHIAPFSFKTRLEALVKAYAIYLKPEGARTKKQEETLDGYIGQIQAILALGITPFDLAKDPHLNGGVDAGVEGSYRSVLKMFDLMEFPFRKKVFKGATEFMSGPYKPVESEAAKNLVKLALKASSKNPLYVIAIACATNIASALLIEPKILPNIVVVWDAGYPTNVHRLTNNSLNLDEDLFASQLLFSCGVPLVYIPGFYIAQQLNMSKPDVESCFQRSGKVGKALINRYLNNPLFSFYGIDPNNLFGRNWVIWDLANVAWLLNPGSVGSDLFKSPVLTDEKKWKINPKGHLIREAHSISVNSIFPVFARLLMEYYGGKKKD